MSPPCHTHVTSPRSTCPTGPASHTLRPPTGPRGPRVRQCPSCEAAHDVFWRFPSRVCAASQQEAAAPACGSPRPPAPLGHNRLCSPGAQGQRSAGTRRPAVGARAEARHGEQGSPHRELSHKSTSKSWLTLHRSTVKFTVSREPPPPLPTPLGSRPPQASPTVTDRHGREPRAVSSFREPRQRLTLVQDSGRDRAAGRRVGAAAPGALDSDGRHGVGTTPAAPGAPQPSGEHGRAEKARPRPPARV